MSTHTRQRNYIVTRIRFQVDIHESIVGAPDSARHTWPGLFNTQHTLDIIAMKFFPRGRIDDGGFDTEERERGTAGLGGSPVRERRDNVTSSFGLPVSLVLELIDNRIYIDDCASVIANHFPVPFPYFGGDWLADGSEDS